MRSQYRLLDQLIVRGHTLSFDVAHLTIAVPLLACAKAIVTTVTTSPHQRSDLNDLSQQTVTIVQDLIARADVLA
jgi:hypothetical protein